MWLLLAFALRSFFPLSRAVRLLGLQPLDEKLQRDVTVTRNGTLSSDQVGRAIENMANRFRFKRSCVLTAYAARMYLRVRGEPCTLVLGVSNANKQSLAAHAWLIANHSIMTGYRGVERYTAVSAFVPTNRKI